MVWWGVCYGAGEDAQLGILPAGYSLLVAVVPHLIAEINRCRLCPRVALQGRRLRGASGPIIVGGASCDIRIALDEALSSLRSQPLPGATYIRGCTFQREKY